MNTCLLIEWDCVWEYSEDWSEYTNLHVFNIGQEITT